MFRFSELASSNRKESIAPGERRARARPSADERRRAGPGHGRHRVATGRRTCSRAATAMQASHRVTSDRASVYSIRQPSWACVRGINRSSPSRRWCPCGCSWQTRSCAANTFCSSTSEEGPRSVVRRFVLAGHVRQAGAARPREFVQRSVPGRSPRGDVSSGSIGPNTDVQAAAAFVALTPIARAVYEAGHPRPARGFRRRRRADARGGAKNHMVVLPERRRRRWPPDPCRRLGRLRVSAGEGLHGPSSVVVAVGRGSPTPPPLGRSDRRGGMFGSFFLLLGADQPSGRPTARSPRWDRFIHPRSTATPGGPGYLADSRKGGRGS